MCHGCKGEKQSGNIALLCSALERSFVSLSWSAFVPSLLTTNAYPLFMSTCDGAAHGTGDVAKRLKMSDSATLPGRLPTYSFRALLR
jgi:hypothetical protein